MAVRVVGGIMKPGHKKHHQSAIRIIEEAVHLLRSAPGSLLAGYYIGSAPFVLGLMYFWADMSRSATPVNIVLWPHWALLFYMSG